MKTLFVALSCAATVFAQETTPTPKDTGASPASAISANAGNPPTAPQPSTAEVQAALQRTFGYDSELSWEILGIRPSGIPGLSDIIVSINKQSAQHIYFSVESQNAIIGSMIPFGPDPFAPIRAKLEAADGPSRGAQNPAINIVEFCDLESPHGKATQPILKKLLTDFPQVRWTFQQFSLPASLHPLDAESLPLCRLRRPDGFRIVLEICGQYF
jgi:protein-disulfide isomerase